jgi:hypothetical protein
VPNVRHAAGNVAISQKLLIAVCKALGVNRSSTELAHDTGHNYKRLETGSEFHVFKSL